jgi:hypothetical protein
MKAHLLKTTDFCIELYDEILAFLSQFNSPIKFVRAEIVSEYELKNKFLFQDAYNHCKSYRKENELPATDVVVILTSKPEFNNWFSHYDLEGNICVVTHDLSDILKNLNQKYFCGYEIVCNILQNSMQLDVHKPEHRRLFIHEPPEGCMNDFCKTKNQIKFKFKTADICSACYSYATQMGVTTAMISQIKALAEEIRFKVTTTLELNVNELSNIVFDKIKHSIYLKDNGTELRLKNLQKAIYLFFMKYKDGVKKNEFVNFNFEFYHIYTDVCNETPNVIRTPDILRDTTKRLGNVQTLYKRVNETNKSIKKLLGEPIANAYCIVIEDNKYKINLPKDKIEILE